MDSLQEMTKVIIRSLVISCPGITADQLRKDYRAMEGKDVPFSQLGKTSLEEFLKDIPDVVVLRKNGHLLELYPVLNSANRHIGLLVQGQNKKGKRKNSSYASR